MFSFSEDEESFGIRLSFRLIPRGCSSLLLIAFNVIVLGVHRCSIPIVYVQTFELCVAVSTSFVILSWSSYTLSPQRTPKRTFSAPY
jgi:hypothetical protein